MFTLDGLLEIAATAEKEYRELLEQYPPGTVHAGRNNASTRMEEALSCAAWMEKRDVKVIANIGPFMSSTFIKGQKVRIMKGAVIHSTHPSFGPSGVVCTRTRVVTVFSFRRGYMDHRDREGSVTQGKIEWVGTGGYWMWTDVNNASGI